MNDELNSKIEKMKILQKEEAERHKKMQPHEILYERIMDALEEFKEKCNMDVHVIVQEK